MRISFKYEPLEPEARLRFALRDFLKSLDLEFSDTVVLWVRSERLDLRQIGEVRFRVNHTVSLSFLETFPHETAGACGAFLCEHAKAIGDFMENVVRPILSDARISGEKQV